MNSTQKSFARHLLSRGLITASIYTKIEEEATKRHCMSDILCSCGVLVEHVLNEFKSFVGFYRLKIYFGTPNLTKVLMPKFFEKNQFKKYIKNGMLVKFKNGETYFITTSLTMAMKRCKFWKVIFMQRSEFNSFLSYVFAKAIKEDIEYNPLAEFKSTIPNVLFFVFFHFITIYLGWIRSMYIFVSCVKILMVIGGTIIKIGSKKTRVFVKDEKNLHMPKVTVLIPLYKEYKTLGQLVNSLQKIEYPMHLMDIKLLLEKDDVVTRKTIQRMKNASFLQVVILPHSKLKTKPRALNYGMMFSVSKYCCVFDAEDIPAPNQLPKAIKMLESSKRLAIVQSGLRFYDDGSSMIATMMNVEYNNLFQYLLPFSAKMFGFVPLGGTSNYFSVEKLDEIGGWNSYNVTEDFEVGMKSMRMNFDIRTIYEVTLEGCVVNMKQWINQRSRWIKGFIISISSRFLFANVSTILKPHKFISFYVLGWMNIVHPFFVTYMIYDFFTNKSGMIIYLTILNAVFYSFFGCPGSIFRKAFISVIYFFYNFIFVIPAVKAVVEIFYKYSFWDKTLHEKCMSKSNK